MKKDKKANDHLLTLVKAGLKLQEKLLESFVMELNQMPEGTICNKQINGSYYFYHGTKGNDGKWVQRLIKANEQGLKQSLLRKRCIRKNIRNFRVNIPLMRNLVQKYRSVFSDVEEEGVAINANMIFDIDQRVQQWKNETFRSNPLFKDKLIHKTTLGIRVRSKSEAVIVELLDANGIPFRYEAELILDGNSYYPDFTILSPSGKVLYWEHFGLMNDENYRAQAKKKINIYFENDIFPCDNLILTYDKGDGSIDASDIQNYINLIIK